MFKRTERSDKPGVNLFVVGSQSIYLFEVDVLGYAGGSGEPLPEFAAAVARALVQRVQQNA